MLLKTVQSGTIDLRFLITHLIQVRTISEAYKTFENAAHQRALKVVI